MNLIMTQTSPQWLRKSPHSVEDTLDRLEIATMLTGNIIRFVRIDQQAVAQSGGYSDAKPIQMLLMENKGFAAAIVKSSPQAAFDLPIRVLVWENDEGQVFIKTTDPEQIEVDRSIPENEKLISTIIVYFTRMLDLATSTQPIMLEK